jgi:hypothetical protein
MTTSPQFKQAILHNLERLSALKVETIQNGTLYATYLKDYSKHGYLRKQKSQGLFRGLFLQKVF